MIGAEVLTVRYSDITGKAVWSEMFYVLFFLSQRGSVLNHNSVNGRSRFAGRSTKMHMVSWMDMPDDVYFVATIATR